MINHWIIRVGDGKNFTKSRYPFWGMKRGHNDNNKCRIKNNFKEGDILWFITSSPYGGKAIGLAEYTTYYDKKDETLVQINTYSNKEQNWDGEEDWELQIHYKNLYLSEKADISIILSCGSVINNYDTFKERLEERDENFICLREHYRCFKKYGTVKEFN
jgi:hypothetical protein